MDAGTRSLTARADARRRAANYPQSACYLRRVKIVLFGATGMIGQGVLRECLLDPSVEAVLTVGRAATGVQHEKLREVVHADLADLSPIDAELAGHDACFYCLGVSAAGYDEAAYTRITLDFALEAARRLHAHAPDMTFVFVSGGGTDPEAGAMWARVKARAEAAILALGFRSACAFRPALIRPRHGAVSRTTSYRVLYAILWPILPFLEALLPSLVTSTEKVGRAMLAVAKRGAPKPVMENADINALAGEA